MCWLKLQGILASPTYSNYMLKIRNMKMVSHEHPLKPLGCFLLDLSWLFIKQSTLCRSISFTMSVSLISGNLSLLYIQTAKR